MGTREVAGTKMEVKDVESRACGAVEEREEPGILCAPPRHPLTETCNQGLPLEY